MKLCVQVADRSIYELTSVEKEFFNKLLPGLVGIPTYYLYWEGVPPIVWPKPSKECKMYQLVEQEVQ